MISNWSLSNMWVFITMFCGNWHWSANWLSQRETKADRKSLFSRSRAFSIAGTRALPPECRLEEILPPSMTSNCVGANVTRWMKFKQLRFSRPSNTRERFLTPANGHSRFSIQLFGEGGRRLWWCRFLTILFVHDAIGVDYFRSGRVTKIKRFSDDADRKHPSLR